MLDMLNPDSVLNSISSRILLLLEGKNKENCEELEDFAQLEGNINKYVLLCMCVIGLYVYLFMCVLFSGEARVKQKGYGALSVSV